MRGARFLSLLIKVFRLYGIFTLTGARQNRQALSTVAPFPRVSSGTKSAVTQSAATPQSSEWRASQRQGGRARRRAGGSGGEGGRGRGEGEAWRAGRRMRGGRRQARRRAGAATRGGRARRPARWAVSGQRKSPEGGQQPRDYRERQGKGRGPAGCVIASATLLSQRPQHHGTIRWQVGGGAQGRQARAPPPTRQPVFSPQPADTVSDKPTADRKPNRPSIGKQCLRTGISSWPVSRARRPGRRGGGGGGGGSGGVRGGGGRGGGDGGRGRGCGGGDGGRDRGRGEGEAWRTGGRADGRAPDGRADARRADEIGLRGPVAGRRICP